MTSTLILPIHHSQVRLGRLVAHLRTTAHDHCREPSQDQGEKNFASDMLAAIAELVVAQALENKGLPVIGYIPYAEKPILGPDMKVGSITYDVKSTRQDSGFVYWSEQQRIAQAHCDYLLPVRFAGKFALEVYAPVPAGEAASWDLIPGKSGRGDFRSVPIKNLKPLKSLTDLPH